MIKKALVVGGSSGIGKSIVINLLKQNVSHVYIVDKDDLLYRDTPREVCELLKNKTTQIKINLVHEDYGCFDEIKDIDALIITAGFGRVARFEDLTEIEVKNLIKCNELAPISIIKKYYSRICSKKDFFCAVMSSISGHIVSPFYSVYGASKAGISMFIENINIELAAQGYKNRVLDCSPGYIRGTAFHNKKDDYRETQDLAISIIEEMLKRNVLYIPKYDEIYKKVIQKYQQDSFQFGIESYRYKQEQGRVNRYPQCIVGYLSGTFDLFHIGHLNLIKNAKKQCDYLIVGVHKSGAWKGKETFISYEERKEIVAACKYVDKAVDSCSEDSDAWLLWHYDKLFVGSDYVGSERFRNYECYFSDKNVEIVYLPYTKTTSSTQLRKAISIDKDHK